MNKTETNSQITEKKLMVPRWEGCWGLGEKGEGMKKYKFASYKSSHEDVKYNMGNIVNNIVITVYGIRWVLNLSG